MIGDEAEFTALFASAWPRLFRATYAVAGDRELAEDALQSAFAKAWAAWPKVVAADDRLAYLRRMAINEALARHRRSWTRREVATATPPDGSLPDPTTALSGSDATWQAVAALPPRQRAVVVLRYYEDLTEREIADILGCRPGTVKSQAAAALATLRLRLADPEGSTR
ncbi:SigE family RNA polymerase sigma factor [Nocardioides speluncae]|uniref:SigE family RNA polymerase sigma factor n=1 Tax=Nocardioides speluncae TaxID=2670337 RepID=UPI000D69FB9E|nr:SigE family RNA polymerase sigma factor [Nocardioides speluncae]